jgi:uncharacterized membrane protein YfhO
VDNLPDNKTRLARIISYILPAILPVIIMGAAFAFNGVYPFGDRQILRGDFLAQYYPFISDYWHKLHEGSSLLWSWTAGAGHDYISHIAYYMASPFNLLAALLPHALLRGALTVFLLIKLGLAGFCMSIYLRYITKRDDILLPVFALMYALCAFTLGYYLNIMWLDSFALLPLVILGVHKLVNEGKFKLYVLSLAGAVIFNFYIGFIVCVFTAMWFFVLCAAQKLKPREFLQKLALITVFSTLAIGITAFLTLPAYSAIRHTFDAVYGNVFPDAINLRYSFFAVLGNFIAFTPPTFQFGLPNIYSGMISIMLLPVFFLAKKISLREKLAFLLVAAFLIVSTNVNMLDYMWHGFSYPNGFPFRYSFLITFALIAMAYRAYISTEDFSKRDIAAMGVVAALLLIIAALGPQKTKYVIWSAVLCGAYLILFALITKGNGDLHRHAVKGATKRKGKSKGGRGNVQPLSSVNKLRGLKLALLALILTELSLSAFIAVQTQGTTAHEDFPPHYSNIQQLLALQPPAENSFYRTDANWRISWNDTSLYGYNGISVWNTLINVDASNYIEGLGLPGLGVGDVYYYARTSPLTDAFLNIRYLIDYDTKPSDDCIFWHRVGRAGRMVLLENKRYLPLGFMVKEETAAYKGFGGAPYRPVDDEVEQFEQFEWLADKKTAGFTPFSAQNDLFCRATGLEGDLFLTVDASNVESDNYKILTKKPGEFTFKSTGKSAEGPLFFDYIMPTNGYLYAYAWVEGASQAKTFLYDPLLHDFDIEKPYIYRVGSFKQGDLVSLAALPKVESGEAWVYAAVLDQALFDQGFALLADETLELTEFTDTKITGCITVKEDGLLYTSIPHAGLWRAFVDGSQAEIITIDGAMAALWLDAGDYTVEFRYHNSALMAGVIISIIAAVLMFLAVAICGRKRLWARK